MKSLVPKHYKSILINLSKNVFSLPRKWQDESHWFSVSNIHIASLDYNNIKNWNPDFDFPRFIIKTDYYCYKINPTGYLVNALN